MVLGGEGQPKFNDIIRPQTERGPEAQPHSFELPEKSPSPSANQPLREVDDNRVTRPEDEETAGVDVANLIVPTGEGNVDFTYNVSEIPKDNDGIISLQGELERQMDMESRAA